MGVTKQVRTNAIPHPAWTQEVHLTYIYYLQSCHKVAISEN